MYYSQAHCPPWTVRAWPPLLWQVGGQVSLPLQHLCTQITQPGISAASRVVGQTLWAAQCDDGEAAMAWDWVELADGVYAMADPMGVVTNLRLVDGSGEMLTSAQAALHLNVLLRSLPWQDEVGRAVGDAARPMRMPPAVHHAPLRRAVAH